MISPLPVTFSTVDAAALMLRSPGAANLPALFLTLANWSLFARAYATSAYVSAPCVFETTPATPELPRAPMPVGQLTQVLLPTRDFQAVLVSRGSR